MLEGYARVLSLAAKDCNARQEADIRSRQLHALEVFDPARMSSRILAHG